MINDETEYLQPVLGLPSTQRFRPLNSIWYTGLLLILAVIFELSSFFMIMLWPKHALYCEPLYLLLYCQCAFWCIVLILDHFLKWQHHKVRLDGYLIAYEKMSKYGSLPFYIVSIGNAAMLLDVAIYHQTNIVLEPLCATYNYISPLIVTWFLLTVELTVLAYVIGVYIVFVYRFNKAQPLPDVNRMESWSSRETFTNQEVGYREHGEAIEELLQKQADLIRYYKDANEILNRRVMDLTSQILR